VSKSKKPRRKYDPNKWLRRTIAVHGARVEASPLTDSQQRDLGLAYHLSFETMLNGGSEEAWHALAATLNVCLILCERGFGAEFEAEIKAGMRALMRCKYRQQQTGSWAFDGDGIAAMRTALEIHDQQIRIAERGEIRAAINEVYRRVSSGDVYAEAA
jgi:hypothetical protein